MLVMLALMLIYALLLVLTPAVRGANRPRGS